jgi:sugar lactone lactonase YvrE
LYGNYMRSQLFGRGVLLLFFLLSACDRGAKSTNGSSAVSVVGNEPRGAWPGGREWRVIEEARIGSVDEGGPEAFANVIDASIDALGRVWVADAQRHQLLVFDSQGTYVRSVGRRGAGPEEFGNIAGMAWDPDERLWVLDAGNARFAVYDTTGKLVSTRPRNSVITASPWPGRFDDSGRMYDLAGEVKPDASVLPLIVRFDSAGQPRDSFRLPRFEPEVFSVTSGDKRNQTITQVGVPFTGHQVWSIDPRGNVWVANTARYRIEQHTFRGGVNRVIERRPRPVRVTRGDRDHMLAGYEDFKRRGGKMDVSRIPDHHPELINFLFDDVGNLWVSPATARDVGRVLDVFAPEGRYLGRVALPVPQRTSLRAIRSDRMVLISRDSLDVPTVIVMRIQKTRR